MLTVSLGASAPLSPSAQATIKKHLPKLSSKSLITNHVPFLKTSVQTVDVACLTEVCGGENLPEIEIFSLLEEQIPKYKIRSDSITDFTGYSNKDWYVPAPALPIPEDGLGLTKDQTRAALNYFVVSGKRVSQMTRVYDDIEAVTRLLEEKEKDLELTVQIGKELLTQNNCLEKRINDLESELKTCKEAKAQLLHELNKKIELIAVLTNDIDDSFDKESPTVSRSLTMETLHKKISALQDENASLKVDALQLTQETTEAEEQERQLMKDIRLQLSETSSEYSHLALELERQQEENRMQHEQIVILTDRLADAEMKLHQLSDENDKHMSKLNITEENQNSLAIELAAFKDRYQEVLLLLKETQEQLRKQLKRGMPHARNSFLASSLFQPDSLCSELMESSLHSENSLDSGISTDTQRASERLSRLLPNTITLFSDDDKTQNIEFGNVGVGAGVGAGLGARCNNIGLAGGNSGGAGMSMGIGFAPPPPPSSYKKAFETVRYATKSGLFNEYGSVSMSEMGAMSMSSSSGMKMSSTPYIGSGTIPPPHCGADGGGGSSSAVSHCYSYIYDGGTCLSEKGITSSDNVSSHSDDGYPSQSAGVPGTPGAKDLEDALKRLTTAEVLARRAMLSYAPVGTYTYDENPTSMGALGIRTPDSLMSTGSGSSGISSSSMHIAPSIHRWRLPDKLQIIKPMEGSQTLNHWSRLATPTLSGLLEERRGVTIRGGRALQDLGIQEYALSDVEEDIMVDLPGKQF